MADLVSDCWSIQVWAKEKERESVILLVRELAQASALALDFVFVPVLEQA